MQMGLENLAVAQNTGSVKPPGQNNAQNETSQARAATPVGASAAADFTKATTSQAVQPTPASASATKSDFSSERAPAVVVDYEKVPIGGPDKFARSMAFKSAKAAEEAVAQDTAQSAKSQTSGTEAKVDDAAATRVQADKSADVSKGGDARDAQIIADKKAAEQASDNFLRNSNPEPVTPAPETNAQPPASAEPSASQGAQQAA